MTAMPRRVTCPFVVLLAVLAMCLPAPVARADARNDAFFERLSSHVRAADTLADPARNIILDALSARDADSDDESLLIEALVLLSPEFRAGLDAYDEEDYAACVAALAPLATNPDLYLSHNARSYTAKALVHANRLIEAEATIAPLLADLATYRQYALDEAEIHYMLGYCQVQNLRHDVARITLQNFLKDYPDASPRFVVTAKQMLAELARRIPESIGEVADLMTFSEKRLAAGDTDEKVQTAQARVIELLDKLIEDVEEQEQNQQNAAQSQQQQNQQRQQQQRDPSNPMPDSQPTQGQSGADAKREGRRVNPGEAWGALPDADREKILQVLRDRFPGRYRVLVEQYYQSLAEQP